jgi:hypothetical protein
MHMKVRCEQAFLLCAPGGMPALRFGVQGVPACVTASAVGQGTPNQQ